ncbi:MAG: hypothetical protein JW888_10025 [Pirellulales bacterium]|nr:hypothetical protein [Pirellulales bacterium]
MRRITKTRGARRSDDATSVSLFPFLAVLICTVGALILLLIFVGRHARVEATQMAEAKKVQTKENLKEQLEDAHWRIGHLRQSLKATQQHLADSRLELGHLEDHARRLRQQLSELDSAWKQIKQAGADSRQQAVLDEQLLQLTSQIDQMKLRVDKARHEALEKGQSYAVVPYEGPHGTRRYPIYLECRSDAIILQPEGIVFKAADFEGTLGPDNPLATALRATREYLLDQGRFNQEKSGEPYPLLLVRPLGIHSYYAAREAMSSWESDFGYELIDEDWKLDFGSPDPKLVQLLRQEIKAARLRQLRLAKAAPRHYQRYGHLVGGERPQYTVSSSSGVVVPYGHMGEPTSPRWNRGRGDSSTPSGPFGGGNFRGSASGEIASNGAASGELGSGGNAPGGVGSGGVGSGGNRPGNLGSPTASGNGGSTDLVGPELGGSGSPGPGGPGGPDGNLALDRGTGGTGDSALPSWNDNVSGGSLGGSSGSPGGPSLHDSAGNPPLGKSENSIFSPSGGSPGDATANSSGGSSADGASSTAVGSPDNSRMLTMGAPGQAAPDEDFSPFSVARGGDDAQAATSEAGGRPRRLGEWHPPSESAQGASPGARPSGHQSRQAPKKLAEQRGRDWAVPDASPGATPLTQPIRIECHADRLVLVPQRGLAGGRTIALGPRTEDSMDDFVSAVWDYTEGWGMAGNGMYWRPLLCVYTSPGAERRCSDLQALLEGSGLLIEKKK